MDFRIWIEEKLRKREIASSLLTALGYRRNALEKQNINLDIIPKGNLKRAIESLPVEPDVKEKLLNFAQDHQHQSLTNLLSQIEEEDVEQQDDTTSQPAILPQSSQPMPKPMQQNPQMQQMNPQMPGF